MARYPLKGVTVRYHTDWSGCTPFRVTLFGDGTVPEEVEISLIVNLGFNLSWPGPRYAELAAAVLAERGGVTLAFEDIANAHAAYMYLVREAAL